MISTDCPRCATPMRPIRLGLRDGGAYREAAGGRPDERGWQCPACSVGLIPGPLVDWVMKRVPVGGGPAERERTKAPCVCPACFATFDALLLGWAEAFVEIEQCGRCRAMLVDPGELAKVFAIEQDSREG